jgi:hypothetical protein
MEGGADSIQFDSSHHSEAYRAAQRKVREILQHVKTLFSKQWKRNSSLVASSLVASLVPPVLLC